ncbi:RDD family protein [Microbacterium esteraromaticum]|uniref:RDD family protein n=1 Tax=Microbacterium esteraromaticum TaxID=57043 RepID=UPI0019D351B0|nr:RDD family protein [Microbacterium esteraromaticum]MBN7793665.1 RDD family protein [Microbacterium esteraromaticum]
MIWEIDDGVKAIEGLDAHGRADPAYAAALGLRAAPGGRRALAALIEVGILLVLALPGVLAMTPVAVRVASGEADLERMLARGEFAWPITAMIISNALVTIFVVVQLLLHGRKGVTVGKALCGIRTVNVRTLERPGFWRGAVVRYLVLSASFLIPLLGPLLVVAFSPLFDSERRGRGWLDQAAATWLVDTRHGLNPYDVKRMRIARKTLRTPEHSQKPALPSLATPVDRDAPSEYIPTGRFSGGVIGAHRTASAPRTGEAGAIPPGAPAPVSADAVSAAPVLSGSGAGFAPAAPSGMVDAVPPPLASDPTPSGAVSAARAVLVLDTGVRVEVRGATLLGRGPAPVAGEGSVQLVPVPDDTLSVSKTHLAFLPARRGVLVVDRGSTNGSSLLRAGSEIPLTPGDPTPLQTGDVVRFGDRSLNVERA